MRHAWPELTRELEREFVDWMTPFLEALGHKARRHWAPLYLRGLIAPGERKSVEPLAARVAPDDYQQLHHFVCASRWDPAPLERVLVTKAQALVGGPNAVLVIDDTTLPKHGIHSVGVTHQYSGQLGKRTTCQLLVSLTLAREEVPVCIALRLWLPESWTADAARCAAAGVPAARAARHRLKWEIALEELDRVRAAGAVFGLVLADAGYGACGEFRRGLAERGLRFAVGILGTNHVYPRAATLVGRAPRQYGRPPIHRVPSHPSAAARAVLAAVPRRIWRRVTWRAGSYGPLSARYAAIRVRVAEGARGVGSARPPGAEVWLVGEWRDDGERKYYVTNLPPATPLRTLVRAIKRRWICEQGHQQMKEELGLDHFEGRSWTGLHHHALLTMIAFAFLQHLRLRAVRARGQNRAARARAAPTTLTAGDSPRRPRHHRATAPRAMPDLSHAHRRAASRVEVAE